VKPGISPSVKHLESLLVNTQSTGVRAILRNPYDDKEPSDWLADRTGIPVIELPATVERGALPGALRKYFDELLDRLELVNGQH
jgi:zinc/manganese transport system substrate-binding protein